MQKKIWTFFLCLFVVALFSGIASAAYEWWIELKQVTKWIDAEDGGVVRLIGRRAVKLVIPPGALEEDTEISVGVFLVLTYEKGSRLTRQLVFEFGPSGTRFTEDSPAELRIKRRLLRNNNIDNVKLYNEDGEEIETEFDEDTNELVFYIPHFSYYYYSRR